tara:strand:+ start:2424 stop:3830 length:1407 start_codon:yes stop_codon:yes gene_type:complete
MNPLLILLIGMIVVIGGILGLRLHAFLALLLGAIVVAILTPADAVSEFWMSSGKSAAEAEALAGKTFMEHVVVGFGEGCRKVGILIALAAVIGKCLLDSGAAERIVLTLRRLFGEKGTPYAFAGSSFIVGIPVFFDTVFYLMMPLAKALRVQTGRNYLLFILCIVAGATMAHSLVPPTPGPLLVASELNVSIGVMMIGGLIVGLITVSSGILYARWANARWEIPLREGSALSHEELEKIQDRDESELPGFFVSLLPILIPIVLLAGFAVLSVNLGSDHDLVQKLVIFGDKNVALAIATVVALILLVSSSGAEGLKDKMQGALSSGGVIILITAAGASFGYVLKQTGITLELKAMFGGKDLLILPVAFFLTVAVRIAQGSATVAMITAVSVVAPLAVAGLAFHPVYVALAIGCGSKPIPWMNDSGFWIIGRMSGMTEGETFKTASIMMSLMGVVGFVVVVLGAWLLPLA